MKKRVFLISSTCVPREKLYESLSLILNASLLLSRGIRRDVCVYIMLEDIGTSYVLEACGNKTKYFRPDIGSSTGFIKRVFKNGCFGGVCLKIGIFTPRSPCLEARAVVENIDVENSDYSFLCRVLMNEELCIKFDCRDYKEDVWWLVAVSNILLDLLAEQCSSG